MKRWILMLALLACLPSGCSNGWVVIEILPAFGQGVLIESMLHNVKVEVVASLDKNAPKTCIPSQLWFNYTELPADVVITESESRDWQLILVRATGYYEGMHETDVVMRRELLIAPNFDAHSNAVLYLDGACHRNRSDTSAPLPCSYDQQCITALENDTPADDMTGEVYCEDSGVLEFFEAEATVDIGCEG